MNRPTFTARQWLHISIATVLILAAMYHVRTLHIQLVGHV